MLLKFNCADMLTLYKYMLISISWLINFLEGTNNGKTSNRITKNVMGQGRNISAWQDLMSQ